MIIIRWLVAEIRLGTDRLLFGSIFFPLIPVDGLKIKMFKKAKKYQQNYDFTPVF